MLNPFYNFDSHGSYYAGGASGSGRISVGRSSSMMGDEEDESDYSSSSCSSNSSRDDQTAQAKPAPLSSKRMNDDCLKDLMRRVDTYVTQCDTNLRHKY